MRRESSFQKPLPVLLLPQLLALSHTLYYSILHRQYTLNNMGLYVVSPHPPFLSFPPLFPPSNQNCPAISTDTFRVSSFHHDSEQAQAYNKVSRFQIVGIKIFVDTAFDPSQVQNEEPHQSSWTHELIAGAAAFEASPFPCRHVEN